MDEGKIESLQRLVNHVVIDVNTKEIVAIKQMKEEMAKCRSH